MAELTGRICLIAGGTGAVGEGIVRAFLGAGATVIVPSRSEERLAALAGRLDPGLLDGLVPLVGDIGDPDDAVRLREAVVSGFGCVDAVVASLGGTWEAKQPITAMAIETWDAYHRSNLRAHFVAACTLLPALAERAGSSYTLLGGLSALLPIPFYSPVGINSAAQLMMAEILMLEMKESRVRINQVVCGYINTRERAAHAKPEWITADEVGAFCAYIASGAGSMVSGAVLRLGDRPPPECARPSMSPRCCGAACGCATLGCAGCSPGDAELDRAAAPCSPAHCSRSPAKSAACAAASRVPRPAVF